jgi:uncharacterized membrane protein YtjA (UPF0391 family)
MLYLAIVFFMIALLAAVLGFGGLVSGWSVALDLVFWVALVAFACLVVAWVARHEDKRTRLYE